MLDVGYVDRYHCTIPVPLPSSSTFLHILFFTQSLSHIIIIWYIVPLFSSSKMDHQPARRLLSTLLLSPWGKVITALVCLKVFAYTKFAYDQLDVEYSTSRMSTTSSDASNYHNTNQFVDSNEENPSSTSLNTFNNNFIYNDNNKFRDSRGFVQLNNVPAVNNHDTNSAAAAASMQQSIDEIQQRLQKKQQQEKQLQEQTTRDNCQVIYILGVEGAIHHGFTPILETLAKSQLDPITGKAYKVTYAPKVLRSALFGLYQETRDMDDPTLIAKVFRELCPPNDSKTKHVIIEDSSFPSGALDDPRSYRIHRQASWMTSTMDQVANDELANNHPTNLYKFYELYSQHANIQFILLHRPFLETMASHANDWGEEVVGRSNMIRGFMLILKRFLVYIQQKEEEEKEKEEKSSGVRRKRTKALSTIVCADKITSKSYDSMYETTVARQHILDYLVEFLGWPTSQCPKCFSKWKESSKITAKVLGEKNLSLMLNDMKEIEGLWPPFGVLEKRSGLLPEQQCSL